MIRRGNSKSQGAFRTSFVVINSTNYSRMSVIRTTRDQGAFVTLIMFVTLKITCSAHVYAIKVTIPWTHTHTHTHTHTQREREREAYSYLNH